MSSVLDRWAQHAHDAGTIQNFLEWCSAMGWDLVDHDGIPVVMRPDMIACHYFKIDPVELDTARRKLLAGSQP